VLDVAGGKGDLSWLLVNTTNAEIDSIVVDPRFTKHRHLCKSVAYLRDHPEEAILRAIPNQASHQPLAELLDDIPSTIRRPRHLRLLFDHYLVSAIQNFKTTNNRAAWSRFWLEALARARRAQTLGYAEKRAEEEESNYVILDADEALETILSARLIVGFHPDQATDSCIDLALLLQIPYCVVPCCVFPSEFMHRRVFGDDERLVRTYSELLEYLKAKDPQHVKIAELKFHGDPAKARKIVIYREMVFD